jgi:hypothetical protein
MHDVRDAGFGARYDSTRYDATQYDGAQYDGRQHDETGAQGNGHEDYHAPLWMNLAMPGGAQFSDERGYVIYVAAEQVASSMYRAWAEIMKDGRRIERSGLIGPRFDDAQAARHFALEWAVEWIDRECGVMAGDEIGEPGGAALAQRAQVASYAAVEARETARPAVAGGAGNAAAQSPVSRPMPESAAAKSALPAAGNRNGNGGGSTQPGTSSYPQHANAHRLQLRRYPSENSASADKTTDRFPPTRKFLSHVR